MKTKNPIGFKSQKLAAKQKQNISISQVVVVQPPKRDVGDIEVWKRAMKAADRGKRAQLVNLYDNLLIDTVLSEAVDARIRHVTNGTLVFLDNNKEVDDMTDFIKSPQFRELLREIMLTKFYGKSVIELSFLPDFSVYSVPRQNLDTAAKVILRSAADAVGIPYNEDDFILNIGKDNDLGIFLKTAPHAIFKRNGGSDYAQFCELFGIPILAGFYDPDDETGREEMEGAFEARGAGGSVVMSNKGDIKTIGETGGNGNTVHDRFLSWCDEQMLIGVKGQTMTTKEGSSRAQSETHADTEDDINSDDRIYTTEILNTMVLPLLQKRGYPVGNGWFVFPKKDNESQETKLDIAERVDRLTEDGVDDDYFYETFGLPRGNKKEARHKQQTDQPEDTEEPEEPEDKKKENKASNIQRPASGKKVKAKQLSTLQKLKNFFDRAPR